MGPLGSITQARGDATGSDRVAVGPRGSLVNLSDGENLSVFRG